MVLLTHMCVCVCVCTQVLHEVIGKLKEEMKKTADLVSGIG